MRFKASMSVASWKAGILALVVAWTMGMAAEVRPEGPVAAPDHSLSVEAYGGLGMPAIGTPWGAAEYTQAGKVLTELAKKDPTQLPRFGSPTSGPVFRRLLAADNLPEVNSKQSESFVRLGAAGGLLSASVPIFMAYANVNKAEGTFDVEVFKLGTFLLRAEVVTILLSDEMLQAYPAIREDAKQMEGLGEIRGGTLKTVLPLIQMFTEHETLRDQVVVQAAAEMTEVLPKAYALFSPEAKKEVRDELAKAISSETVAARKAALLEMQQALGK